MTACLEQAADARSKPIAISSPAVFLRPWGGGLCLPGKGPLYPKCISPDLSAILIQKDDAEAQGIRANPRQKNRATWQGQR